MEPSPSINKALSELLNNSLIDLENCFNSDVLTYYGPLLDGFENTLLKIVEDLANAPEKRDQLAIILTTTGGSASVVERYVSIIRHHYSRVIFIVPDYAYSAGTIFCMSGDEIWMDYFSVLGPIDPQVKNKEGKYVPALGYLDKIDELIEKAKNNQLTSAEFLILKDFDLAELKAYEQAKELTITLLKKWLVKYKFRNWDTYSSSKKVVSLEDKERRAEDIAACLGDNKRWKSHGRPINIEALHDLKLLINDYSSLPEREFIRSYYELIRSYITRFIKYEFFIHTRKYL
jgi:hypothetical protein